MGTVFRLIFRLLLLAASLVFVVSLLLVTLLFFALWGVRALWARLTGRPVPPFVRRFDTQAGFGSAFRARSGTPPPAESGPAPSGGRRRLPDIEDVEVKPPRD